MKYWREYKVKYQDVDDRRRLRLYNLENYFLETAGDVADELGFGIRALYPMGLTWILSRLSVEMYELPTHGDRIWFETWIESNVHMLSTRDFRIYKPNPDPSLKGREEKILIGQCKSVWAILDLEKREVANIFDHPMFANAIDGEVIDMARIRMTTLPEPTGVVPHRITYSDLDYNGHCNSCKYLETMLNAYRPDYIGKRVRLDINYQKEVMEGDELQTLYLVTDDGVQYQQKNQDGETSCSAKITVNG